MADENQKGDGQAAETEWLDACALSDVPAGGGKYVELRRKGLAVFKLGEQVRVISDVCPHAGGSLASGYIADGCVYCPWHGWPFRIENGECPDNPSIKVPTYEVRVVEGRVQVRV